jgi:hypothetical protein
MFKFYWISCRDQCLGCVKAVSKQDAENQAYMKHGSASRYTGNGRNHFRAELMVLGGRRKAHEA